MRDFVDLRHVLGAERPIGGLDVLLDLLRRVAPAITLETCSRAASQLKASSSIEWPRVSQKSCSVSTIGQFPSVM
ncbi:MAG: hypothetical protein WDN69_17475 [Aliidongia sp.]